MKKMVQWVKQELKVEFMCCTYAMTYIFLYGCLLYFEGITALKFSFIFEMFIMAYIITWLQTIVFRKNKYYKKFSYYLRVVIWFLIPIFTTVVTDLLFGWSKGRPLWFIATFYSVLIIYVFCYWLFLQYELLEDTAELNSKLKSYQQNNNYSKETEAEDEDD